jgi:hypothetical protein
MKRGALPVIAWGLWLAVWTGVLFVFVDAEFPTRQIEYDLLGGAAFAVVLSGLVIWRLDVRARDADPSRSIVTDSVASVTTALGLAMVLVGASFGLWLILMGAGVAALGLGGLAREERARRRDARLARGSRGNGGDHPR